jgi:hypothetical protein
MRICAAVALLTLAGCKPPPAQQDSTPAPGSTTYTRGTPTVRSETTHAVDTSATRQSEVTVTLDRGSYAPGATATVRVVSRSSDTLGYNQCSSRLIQRSESGTWVTHPEPGRMCTMELRLLRPGEMQTFTTDLPPNLTPATYRLVLALSRQRSAPPGASGDGSVQAASAPFTVR